MWHAVELQLTLATANPWLFTWRFAWLALVMQTLVSEAWVVWFVRQTVYWSHFPSIFILLTVTVEWELWDDEVPVAVVDTVERLRQGRVVWHCRWLSHKTVIMDQQPTSYAHSTHTTLHTSRYSASACPRHLYLTHCMSFSRSHPSHVLLIRTI